MIEVFDLQSCLGKAESNGVDGKRGIVFFSGKSFFLGGGYDFPIDNDGRSRIVIKR
jgi:hypothetical protein